MTTIQIRDLADEDAEMFRRRAELSGMSVESYMRNQLARIASRRTRTETLAAVGEALARDLAPGGTTESILEAVREVRAKIAHVATIQVRNIPEESAALLREAAAAEGMSLQAYMQRELIALAQRRAKAAALTAYRKELADGPSPGVTGEFIVDAIRELRGE